MGGVAECVVFQGIDLFIPPKQDHPPKPTNFLGLESAFHIPIAVRL